MRPKASTSLAVKFGLRHAEVSHALGSEQLYRECREAGWLKPVVDRHKLQIFDARQVEACWLRILAGEVPTKKVEAAA